VLGLALAVKADLLRDRMRVVEAAALYGGMADVARLNDLPLEESLAHGNLADIRSQSDLPGAEAEHKAALELAERLGSVVNQAVAFNNLALHHFYAGDWDRTESYARRAIGELAEEWQVFGRYPLALLLAARGRGSDATRELNQLSAWADGVDVQDRTAYRIADGSTALAEGRTEDALLAARLAADEAAEASGFMSESFRLAWPLALEAALRSDKLTEAAGLLAKVSEASPGHVPPYLRAQLARYTALLDVAKGETSEVEENLRSAVETLGKLGYRYWLARAEADLARWLTSQGRGQEAGTLLSEAISTLTELGAQPDLDRLGATAASATG
jgi:hypothetical protein